MKRLLMLGAALAAGVASAITDLECAEISVDPKNPGAKLVLTPLVGETDFPADAAEDKRPTCYRQAGRYDVWNDVAFTFEAKDEGRYFIHLAVPHNVRRLFPEVAYADLSIEGAGKQENLDFAEGFSCWGCSTKAPPRIATVDGRRAMIVRSDRKRYRGVDLKAGDKVTVTAKFRLMGPSEVPARQQPLDVTALANGVIPEGVALPYAKRDFLGIFVKTADPSAAGATPCVRFRNGAIQEGVPSVTLLDGPAEPARYLYLLVSSSYTKGPVLATADVTYADGSQEKIPVRKGTELDDWFRAFANDSVQPVWSANGENGLRTVSLTRLVLDERKAPRKIVLATGETGNLCLYGATLTGEDWRPRKAENLVFTCGGEWRKPDMPSRNIVAGSAIDLSRQLDFAPCGTYGKIFQKGDHLYFEKRPDKPLRFMGNHSSHNWVCDWEPDEKVYCEQMQRTGCNAIRLSIGRLDGEWWIDREENHRRLKYSDGWFLDDRIDNFMRFIAEFNRRGIYLLFGSGTGPVEIEAMMAGDREALEYYRQITIRLLTKRNPYTGNLIKDEPCVLGWEFANEQSVQHVAHIVANVPNPDTPNVSGYNKAQQKYAARVCRLVPPRWEAFLKRKYGADWEAHKEFPKRYTDKTQNALDFQLFSQELMDEHLAFYYGVMKEVGWDKPMMWGNYDKILRTTETRVKNGMATEVNNYHSFLAEGVRGPQISSPGDGMSVFRDMAGAAIPGKTVFITEFNDCQHNKYCHEMGLAAGAIASLQGWDAFFLHNSTVITDAQKPVGYFAINDGLVIANHPSMRASTFLLACLYGRGDAATSPHTVKLDYAKAFMQTLSSTSYPDPQQLRTVMLCGTRVDWPEYGATPDYRADLTFPGFGNDSNGTYEFLLAQSCDSKARTAVLETMVAKMREKGILKPGNRTDVKKGIFESDTGEILIETTVPRMKIVTARTEAMTLPANGAYRADCLDVVRTQRNATFAAVAVDGQPLAASRRITLVMDGESAIDGSVKTPDRVRYVEWGPRGKNKQPLAEKIWRTNVAKIRLRNVTGAAFTLYPLSVNGIRRAPLPVTREGDDLVFTLDTNEASLPHGITPYFELVQSAGESPLSLAPADWKSDSGFRIGQENGALALTATQRNKVGRHTLRLKLERGTLTFDRLALATTPAPFEPL